MPVLSSPAMLQCGTGRYESTKRQPCACWDHCSNITRSSVLDIFGAYMMRSNRLCSKRRQCGTAGSF